MTKKIHSDKHCGFFNTYTFDNRYDYRDNDTPAPADETALNAADNTQQSEEANGGNRNANNVENLSGCHECKQSIDHAQKAFDE